MSSHTQYRENASRRGVQPILVTREQTAEMWSCSISTVIRAERAGLLTPLKLFGSPAGKTYYDIDQVVAHARRGAANAF